MGNQNLEIEHQYELYLKRMKLDISKMHPQQRTETKRAFMGGFTQMLVLLRTDVAGIEDEDRAVLTLEDLNTQLEQFWNSQI